MNLRSIRALRLLAPAAILAATALTTGCIAVGAHGSDNAPGHYQLAVTEPNAEHMGLILKLDTTTGDVYGMVYDEYKATGNWEIID